MNRYQLAYSATDIDRLSAIDAALGTKDRYTQRHAHRVALYAMRLACRCGLPPDVVGHIGIGGMLHDVGKIGLNQQIFKDNTTRLCREMQDEVRRHPYIGVSLLKGIDFLSPVLDYVYYHHERMDGSGYPCGLTADQIPLGAKIIGVVDCFDAITTDRPYQKRKSCRKALDILRQMSARSLCPELVETFVAEISENGMIRG